MPALESQHSFDTKAKTNLVPYYILERLILVIPTKTELQTSILPGMLYSTLYREFKSIFDIWGLIYTLLQLGSGHRFPIPKYDNAHEKGKQTVRW